MVKRTTEELKALKEELISVTQPNDVFTLQIAEILDDLIIARDHIENGDAFGRRKDIMAGINRVLIVGNVGRDPEIKRLNNGNSIASFSIATSDKWRYKQSG